jgi:hypothetical protein
MIGVSAQLQHKHLLVYLVCFVSSLFCVFLV